ncbi:UDP-4-amino-4,6-dideoxy-N-acetyl-beta-L-altrosamine transaminase [Selenomonas ruminantium]|uniref:UDP-4-amino-4,6-dideoxy-N-acetyl-beta-L-altrosamine transaminase n=1 Tax=Selenomonas ruminantium TaxID=971 RepID=A0A1H0TY34_SELRU|nr:UDP-4-amino-4,6-dideoxy-N-acetyl-beta-L-altrosamine transaminase [Selenomonas ruminantium]SDP58957.1 UDP-4-amino-4,6-dideoxy-N-acetyl-beta-L-altrosamine transaminase [Selenomonas ruminantium]
MDKIALFGGKPVREKKIFYGHQLIEDDDIRAVSDVLKSDYLTCGPKIDELEQKLCEITGAKYAVVVSNGTAALHVACMAVGVTAGDEVITTPITFAASANCAAYCGAKPVFADINPETYNIDPAKIKEKINARTKAVVAVDFTGQAVEADDIAEICHDNGLIFIEDAAHSIGTKYKGRSVGTLADITTFSFHPVKTVTSGEGGAVLTNDYELYKKIVLASHHGITHEVEEMRDKNPEGPWYYEEIALGYNYRMTDFQAALLLSQLKKLDRFSKRRKEIVDRYNKAFEEIPEIFVQKEIPESDTTRHLYIIQLVLDKLSCSRREFFDAMAAENVQCQVHYVPVYWFPYYEDMGYKKGLCPEAEKMYRSVMSIPLYPAMTDQEVDDVIKAVKKLIEYYRK